jgi:hypothetical protein
MEHSISQRWAFSNKDIEAALIHYVRDRLSDEPARLVGQPMVTLCTEGATVIFTETTPAKEPA